MDAFYNIKDFVNNSQANDLIVILFYGLWQIMFFYYYLNFNFKNILLLFIPVNCVLGILLCYITEDINNIFLTKELFYILPIGFSALLLITRILINRYNVRSNKDIYEFEYRIFKELIKFYKRYIIICFSIAVIEGLVFLFSNKIYMYRFFIIMFLLIINVLSGFFLYFKCNAYIKKLCDEKVKDN